MYSQVPKWTLSPSPSLYPARATQANRRRTKNKVHDPKTESLASDENELPTNNTSSNFAFSTGAISPSPHRAVRFDKRRYGGRRGWKDGKICLALKDLRLAVPEKIGSGLQAILQGVTGEVSTITGQPDSGKSTLLDVLACSISLSYFYFHATEKRRFGLNTRQAGEMVINDRQQSLSGDATSVIGRKERGEEIGNDGKGEVQVQILKKPRFLCLHGFRTSSEILQKQLQRWPEAVLEKFDLVFIDAPYKAQGRSMVEGFYDPPYYEWFQFTEDYSEVYNFEECVDYIEDFMVKHGPFDGLMGFSQGGILSAALPGMQSDGVAFTKVPKIKYLIIMSGGKLGGTGSKFCIPKLAANAFSTPVQCPSLHIIGEADYFKESGIELLDAFVDPLVILHQKGHTIARLGYWETRRSKARVAGDWTTAGDGRRWLGGCRRGSLVAGLSTGATKVARVPRSSGFGGAQLMSSTTGGHQSPEIVVRWLASPKGGRRWSAKGCSRWASLSWRLDDADWSFCSVGFSGFRWHRLWVALLLVSNSRGHVFYGPY
ncbi:hypothetical protein RHSIM_Rhsim10G0165600 [Rhododendron simsii]|uniref:Serine hydrolase domain-containing protein n=1 Tax=Rhododendron simsii TaxID=118357 RepID=A0A834GC92_RHOSS|nr:hypothetical protein RHSIM_Rhsim10G0165600 [Rhododendron simsii]